MSCGSAIDVNNLGKDVSVLNPTHTVQFSEFTSDRGSGATCPQSDPILEARVLNEDSPEPSTTVQVLISFR